MSVLNKYFNLKLIKPVCVFFLVIICISLSLAISIRGENQFSLLSSQFLSGKIYLPNESGDAVLYKGNYYWHLGPFPAILLVPFTLISHHIFSVPMPQGLVNFFLILAIIFLVIKVSLKNGFSKNDSMWVSLATVFGSVFFLSGFLPWSWHFSQTVTFLLGLLAFYELLGKKRPFLIGLLHAFMFLTRVTSGFGIIFYVFSFLFSKNVLKNKIKDLLMMFFPIVLSGLLLIFYNYSRFENFWNNGYKNTNNWVKNSENINYELSNYGLFSFRNIPTNFYYYFINMPSPVLEKHEGFNRQLFKTDSTMIIHLKPPFIRVSTPGVSFFVVSPIFLLIFRNKIRNKRSLFALITSLFILTFLLTYYWTGWTQIGPRYMIDLMPFLLILFLDSYNVKKVTELNKFVITISVIFNTYLFFSLF